MINFRKLRQDFSSQILKEGKELYEKQKVISAKIVHLDGKSMKIAGRVLGQYDNCYESEIEIDRIECETIDSNCDCPYNYDCQHLAALLFFLEENLDKILVEYSKETDLEEEAEKRGIEEGDKNELFAKLKEAESKEVLRQEGLYQKQVLQEYVVASHILADSPFFRTIARGEVDKADLHVIFSLPPEGEGKNLLELQLALRLPCRSKPLHISFLKQFLEAVRYEETILMGGKRYCFSLDSFEEGQKDTLRVLMDHVRFIEVSPSEKTMRSGFLDIEVFGVLLAGAAQKAADHLRLSGYIQQDELPILPGFYEGTLEQALHFSSRPAGIQFQLEYIKPPTSKILVNPVLLIGSETVTLEEVRLFACQSPGMLHKNAFYRFRPHITRLHLKDLKQVRDVTIPEPLFGSFVENSLPELAKYAEIANKDVIEGFVTLPFTGALSAECHLSYLDGELEAALDFIYEDCTIPASAATLTYPQVTSFIKEEGILARNLVEEKKIIEDLFQDFTYLPETGAYISKSDKKIVEFMTEIVPRNQQRVQFNSPQNLLDQFIYDQTEFTLCLRDKERIDSYELELQVSGALKGVRVDTLWECMATKKAFIELDMPKVRTRKPQDGGRMQKILVLDLERIGGIAKLFDELGIEVLDNHVLQRPLWSLASMEPSQFEGLPVQVTITDKLADIRKQMLGERQLEFSAIPEHINAKLRSYQLEGVKWLERLRSMYLNGILADDMGLGKTLQAIVTISQHKQSSGGPSLIVCPTSLLYNWKEEFSKFNGMLQALVVDGIPSVRKKMIDSVFSYDVVITSYTLLQKDIEHYKDIHFAYVILDEAQHIKNRGTRNARSVKMVQADHRLILSGTPIENSLEELWSLFDFLMPGFLSTYDRFVEKYVRISGPEQTRNLEFLKKKVSPFILRRMKSDVLDDLPPISEIVYHCQLSDTQKQLYRSYAESARDELVRLVEKEGFDRVQIHVLATLTRLKQICCHPAIFAKEEPELGDSAKYDMLLDLLETLVEGKHKTVVFSQYTRMLQIMRGDFEQRGIRFAYLDGSTKDRLEVVRQFNEDPNVPVFLVSLKAGGTGLNLVGADTVIHYDMWWNPAVENQATDRVHRMGQKNSVSSYKLITLGTIEEKIAEMQKRKKGLVKKVVSCDDEAMEKLTWEDVLELLKT